jgi:hypothetical protein
MFLKLFVSRQQVIIILILILSAAFWLPSIINYNHTLFVFDFYPVPVYNSFKFFEYYDTRVTVIISLILLLLSGFLLVRLNAQFFFIPTRTQLPAFFYIFICSSFIPLHRFNPVLISNIFLIFAIFRIFSSFKKEQICYNYFDSALLISVGSLFYFNMIFMIAVVWIGLIILRPFIWREWVFTIIGIAVPYILLFSCYYLLDLDIENLLDTYKSYLTHFSYDINFNLPYLVIVIYYLLMLVISSIYMISVYAVKKIYSRKYFMFFLWLFIVSVAIYYIVPSAGYEMIIVAALSISFLFAHFFVSVKPTWLNRVLFDMFFGILIYLRLANM